jgi:hypothetical protein
MNIWHLLSDDGLFVGYQMFLLVYDTVTTTVKLEKAKREMKRITSAVQRVHLAPSQLWNSLAAARVSV